MFIIPGLKVDRKQCWLVQENVQRRCDICLNNEEKEFLCRNVEEGRSDNTIRWIGPY